MTPVAATQAARDIRMDTTYSTTDINAAAFLLASGLQLSNVRRDGTQVTFVFEDSSTKAAKLVLQYASNASAPVRSFADAQKMLKTLTFRY